MLRLSLNTPVVAIEQLPVGPAAAGIALHQAPAGRSLVLAIRAVRTGQMLFFVPDTDWQAQHGPELALEAALSFAESMGFLFDDDAARDDGARKWTEFLAEAAPEVSGPEVSEQLVAGLPPAKLLSKFRLRPLVAPPVMEPSGPALAETWVRLLSRF